MKLLVTILIFCCIFTFIQSEKEHDVIIVGGGAAGIAAATRLYSKGVDFILLEAESQVGGRVKSVHFGQSKVDIGAQWVHGEKNNIVNDLMKDTGLLHHTEQNFRTVFSDAEETSKEFCEELVETLMEIYESTENNAITDQSVGDYFIKEYTKMIKKNYANDEKKRKLAMQALPMMERVICSLEAAFNWHLPSANSDAETCEGDHFVHWNGKGYFSALEFLMKDFNSTGRVFTNKVVTKIEMKPDCVIVKGEEFEYKGRYVIFTPSLGVLKNHHGDMFDPPLTERRVKAIETLGFGAIHKVWLNFPESWWGNDSADINMAWTWEDLYTLKTQFPKGPHHGGKSFLTNFYGVLSTPQNPRVLSAWFTGEFVPEIEKMDDDILIDGIMFSLNKFVGHLYKIEKPASILRGKWYSNKHFHGTYSYQTVESRKLQPGGNEILAEPIKSGDGHDRLYFAGEATHLKYYSTVHGAIETGHREADHVIEVLQSNKV